MPGYVTLWIISLAVLAGAVIGQGFKIAGMEIPVITSGPTRALLATVGMLGIILGFITLHHEDGTTVPVNGSEVSSPPAPAAAAPEQTTSQQPDTSTTKTNQTEQYLGHYQVDLASGYHLPLSDVPARPQGDQPSGDDLYFYSIGGISNTLRAYNGQLAVLDSTAISYQACRNDTRFTTYIDNVVPGTLTCYTGKKLLVGIKVVTIDHDDPSHFAKLDVSAWRTP